MINSQGHHKRIFARMLLSGVLVVALFSVGVRGAVAETGTVASSEEGTRTPSADSLATIDSSPASSLGSSDALSGRQGVATLSKSTKAAKALDSGVSILAATYQWDGSTLTINGHVAGSLQAEVASAAAAGLPGYSAAVVTGLVVNGEAIATSDWVYFRGDELGFSQQPAFPNIVTLDIQGTATTRLAYFDEFENFTLKNLPLTTVILPTTIQTIGHSVFANLTSLRTVENVSNVTSIETFAFYGTALPEASYPNVTSVGRAAFAYTNLVRADFPKLITIENSTDGLYAGAFRGCASLVDVNMPLVQSIGMRTFRGDTSLRTIELPRATSLGIEVFWQCSNLAVVYLPEVTTLDQGCFNECSSLSLLIVGSVPTLNKGTSSTYFNNVSPTAIAMYSNGNPSMFSTAEGWNGGTAHYVPLVDQTVTESDPASFVFITEGSVNGDPAATSPANIPSYLNVKWVKNGTTLSSDTTGTLTFDRTVVSDSGTYRPIAYNTSVTPGSWDRWTSATLTVNPIDDGGGNGGGEEPTQTPTKPTPSTSGSSSSPKTGDGTSTAIMALTAALVALGTSINLAAGRGKKEDVDCS